MEAKLIKDKHIDDFYYLKIGINTYATTDKESFRVLSLKNCEAIELGYDLDELAEAIGYASEYGHPSPEGFSDEQIGRLHGFNDGFQKALEIIGDKKFSSRNMFKAFITGVFTDETSDYDFEFTELMQDLQQTEWDVSFNPEEKDFEGCLILKRL